MDSLDSQGAQGFGSSTELAPLVLVHAIAIRGWRGHATSGEFLRSFKNSPTSQFQLRETLPQVGTSDDMSNSSIKRSENMRRIRSKDTKPEMLLRRALHKRGIRYRIQVKRLPGSPDLFFPTVRLTVFVHGCFWHRHPNCREASAPKSNSQYWESKLNRNMERDRETLTALEQAGYTVLILWECDIERDVDMAADAVIRAIHFQKRV